MRRFGPLSLILVCLVAPVSARHDVSVCGTSRETPNETLFLHRQSVRARLLRPLRALAAAPPSADRDIGNIAVIDDADGVVERMNQFNLDNNTVTFTPAAPGAAHYRYSVAQFGYDSGAATQATPLAALDDDDTRLVSLPFAFPFFGATYNQVFVNSDGNLTFAASDFASTDRSLGRMTAGPPRISPLFDDLNPAQTAGGVRVFADSSRVVVSWVSVPEYSQYGAGPLQTFQVRLYPDGTIQFSYSGVNPSSAVVGIAPGNLQGSTTLVDFRNDASGDYSAAVAERFGGDIPAIDIVTVAQKFYQTHEDAYDYVVIYNNMDIPSLLTAVAYESTVRSSGTGYGFAPEDTGQQYGSASRLHSVLNMGQLSEYPKDPNGLVPLRFPSGDTPLTILAHETGHLFLAFASVKDPKNPSLQPMLGYGGVHWSFVYDSEASLLEGERIADRGADVSPRFMTTNTVQGYSPLDQYLMGFRPAEQVPDTFYVADYPSNISPLSHPIPQVGFDGTRRNVNINDVIQVEGRRTPDYTVAQRRFRFAFILVVAQGSQPSAADLSQVDAYRQQFETFYAQASSNNAVADTTLKRSMELSLAPNAGVVAGGSGSATLTLETPPSGDMTVQFQAPNGYAQLPTSVRIPAGAASASFAFSGLKSGVEEVLATPSDPSYETASARVQVADASILKLIAVSGDRQLATSSGPLPDPIVVRLTDANNLPYPGARIVATPSTGGSVTPAAVVTDAQGQAAFRWTPGPAASNQLHLALESLPAGGLMIGAGSAVPVVAAVVNAASFVNGVAAGALETIYGVNLAGGQTARAAYPWPATAGLAGVRVLLNGSALPLLYVSDTQINFYVPQSALQASATLTVATPSGSQAATTVNIAPVQPGIFSGGVLHSGTGVSALISPVHAGDYLEIYCTGLGPTQTVGAFDLTALAPIVFIGATPVQPVYSGLAPGYVGLYQVNVRVPTGIAPGVQPLLMSVDLAHSNQVDISIQ